MERQAKYKKKIFENYILDKALVSRIFKDFSMLNSKEMIQLKNGQKGMNRHFTKMNIQMETNT